MDLSIYLNCRVYITLTNSYNYIGQVIFVDEDGLTLIDKNNQKITINKNSISFIKEIK